MSVPKPAKKTGTIEVRLSDELKAAFAERCRRDDLSISEAIRQLMQGRLHAPADRARGGRGRLIAAGLLGVTLGFGAAPPSFAQAGAPSRPTFEQLDRDGNGVLTRAEYRR